MLFVFRPDPDGVALKSKAFWEQQVSTLKYRLDRAQDDYDRLLARYDDEPTNFAFASDLARAEDALAEAKRNLKASQLKYHWESEKQWARTRKPSRAAAKFFRETIEQLDWSKIFKPRRGLNNGPE